MVGSYCAQATEKELTCAPVSTLSIAGSTVSIKFKALVLTGVSFTGE